MGITPYGWDRHVSVQGYIGSYHIDTDNKQACTHNMSLDPAFPPLPCLPN